MGAFGIGERVRLGATDVQISLLGVGAWSWGDRFFWGYGRGYDDGDVAAAYHASLELGANFFDTAEFYGFGRSERLLGDLISNREAIVVATKFMPFPWRYGRQAILRAVRGSLRRLGVEQVDLYQMHWPSPIAGFDVWVDGLVEAVETGLVRAVGVSNYSARQMREAHRLLARRGVPLASNQVEYSLLERAPERNGLLDACRELDVTLIAYSPIAMGALTGKYTPDKPPPGWRGQRYNRRRLTQIQPLLQLMREIGERQGGKTLSQVALNWTMCKGTVPIPGAKNERQARENAGALGWRLTDADVAALDERGLF